MADVCCPMHGAYSCVILKVVSPIDVYTSEPMNDIYSLMGYWKCKKCERTGLENMKKMYDHYGIDPVKKQ